MFWFIVFLLFVVVGLGIVAAGAFSKPPERGRGASEPFPRWAKVGLGLAVMAAGALILFGAGVNSVPTRSEGVPVSFGRAGAPMGPGFHWLMPWVNVADISETIQTTTFEGPKGCLDVRIGGQQTACLDVTIQWQVDPRGATGLFLDYTGQGPSLMKEVTNAVVVRELKQVVNAQLGDYNPIYDVSTTGKAGNSQFTTLGPLVLHAMRTDLRGRVLVHTVLMPLLRYDGATQAQLNRIQQQYGATAIAQQLSVTNTAQAAANKAISASLSGNPLVLIAQCLQITQDALKAGTSLPPGWSCLGNQSNLALAVKG